MSYDALRDEGCWRLLFIVMTLLDVGNWFNTQGVFWLVNRFAYGRLRALY